MSLMTPKSASGGRNANVRRDGRLPAAEHQLHFLPECAVVDERRLESNLEVPLFIGDRLHDGITIRRAHLRALDFVALEAAIGVEHVAPHRLGFARARDALFHQDPAADHQLAGAAEAAIGDDDRHTDPLPAPPVEASLGVMGE